MSNNDDVNKHEHNCQRENKQQRRPPHSSCKQSIGSALIQQQPNKMAFGPIIMPLLPGVFVCAGRVRKATTMGMLESALEFQ
jgi:hypothetical protein